MKLITRFLYLSAAGIMLLTSCAKEQTEAFLAEFVRPVLEEYKDLLGAEVSINV